MIRWGNIHYLYLLLLVPLLIFLLFYIKGKKGRQALEEFSSSSLLLAIAPNLSFARKRFKDFLIILATTSLIIALADPQIGTRLEEIKREGIDLVVAIDCKHYQGIAITGGHK